MRLILVNQGILGYSSNICFIFQKSKFKNWKLKNWKLSIWDELYKHQHPFSTISVF